MSKRLIRKGDLGGNMFVKFVGNSWETIPRHKTLPLGQLIHTYMGLNVVAGSWYIMYNGRVYDYSILEYNGIPIGTPIFECPIKCLTDAKEISLSLNIRMRGDIGEFGELTSSLMQDSQYEESEVAKVLSGFPNHNPCIDYYTDVLPKQQCNNLVEVMAAAYSLSDHETDYQLEITKERLIEIIGERYYNSLLSLFQCAPTHIKLRRVEVVGKGINFHTDVSRKTLQIRLNENYIGGNLIYLLKDNSLMGLRDNTIGCATIHDNHTVHGVSKHVCGVRYSLFFLLK